jgi:hypothetical protein
MRQGHGLARFLAPFMVLVLIATALSSGALADEASSALKAGVPKEEDGSDAALKAPNASGSSGPTNRVHKLQGGVSVHNKAEPEAADVPLNAPIVPPDEGNTRLPTGLSIDSLKQIYERRVWSPEQLRKAQYGILGVVASRNIDGPGFVVQQLHRGCPAFEAGVRCGDIELQVNSHVFSDEDMLTTFWKVSAGRAGTPVKMVVLRGRQILTFDMVRLNIEDIPDITLRRMYERQLIFNGPPQE